MDQVTVGFPHGHVLGCAGSLHGVQSTYNMPLPVVVYLMFPPWNEGMEVPTLTSACGTALK